MYLNFIVEGSVMGMKLTAMFGDISLSSSVVKSFDVSDSSTGYFFE